MDKEVLLRKLGDRIRTIRKEKGITQTELAHKLNKDQPSINRLETGKINPSYYYLHEIAGGLGVAVEEIFKED
jgi:transcriptional regulator with XRE-family HTH domain